MAEWLGTLENLVMNRMFWHTKKVFLTGHTGFKGSWLSLWLQLLGAQASGFALQPPTSPSLFDLGEVSQGMHSQIGDIRDLPALQSALKREQPDIVIHMAAQSLVRYAYQNPVETFETNVMGTVHVLEAARHCDSVRVVLCVTSDKCYENREWVWGYRENDPMGGHDPYSGSKGCSELVVAAYRRSFFSSELLDRHPAAIASVRAGNVIGGGDWAKDRLVPDTLKAFMESRPVCVRNPHAVRPWQFVLDPLAGYLRLVEKLWDSEGAFTEGWNFGPGDEDARPVQWVVEKIAEFWSERASWQVAEGQHAHEAHYLKLDCSKAREHLQWKPRLSLTEALAWTVDWYRGFQDGKNMAILTKKQITDYEMLEKT
jgi:CDP-glucose 4,6-dehydratase